MIYKAVGYCRLSSEDNQKIHKGDLSNSIENQKNIILNYINRNPEIEFNNFYIDDGYSGTITSRPGFRQMLLDMDNGHFNTIIAKDASRISRELETRAYLLFRLFPEKDIRFIAIDNHSDSLKEGYGDMNQYFSLFMDCYYPKDISRKVMSVLNNKRLDGKFIGAFAPYGYKKSSIDKNKLVPDLEAAKIVQRIFNLFIQGNSKQMIANTLNNEGILCPTEYKHQKKQNYQTPTAGQKLCYQWEYSTIHKILNNEVYIGNLVQRRSKMVMIVEDKITGATNKRKKALQKDQYIRVLHTHEPILPAETFLKAQAFTKKIVKSDRTKMKIPLYSHFLRCNCCGKFLNRSQSILKNHQTGYYYRCCTYATYGKNNPFGCTSHSIREDRLSEILCQVLSKVISVQLTPQKPLNFIMTSLLQTPSSYDQHLLQNKTYDLHKIQKRKETLLDSLAEGLVTKSDFQKYWNTSKEQEEELKRNIDVLEKKQRETVDGREKKFLWLQEILEGKICLELDRACFIRLIENIVIYDKHQVHIFFSFSSVFPDLRPMRRQS